MKLRKTKEDRMRQFTCNLRKVLTIIGMSVLLLLCVYARAFAENSESLVAIAFDDAHQSFPFAVEQMRQRGLVGTVYVPTGLVGKYDFHTTWDALEKARDSGWEIGNHSATHPDMTKMSPESVADEMDRSTHDLEAHGMHATSFAPPFGEFNDEILEIVKRRFSMNRMAWGETVIRPENVDVWRVPVFDLSHVGTTYAAMETTLQKAIDARGLVIVLFHKVAISEADSIDRFTVNGGDFTAFLQRISELRSKGLIRCVTVSKGIAEIVERSQK